MVPTQEIQLRHKVASLLHYLLEHRDRIISKEELLDKLWQHGDYRENSLIQSIRELRVVLGDNAKQPTFIKTYPQRGYQWICDLENDADLSEKVTVNKRKLLVKGKYLTYIFGLTITLLLAGIIMWVALSSPAMQEQEDGRITSLLVLPFINATDDPSMAWLELGLADMLAIDIQRIDHSQPKIIDDINLQITPPAMANSLLLDAQLQWPSLPVYIRSLLLENNLQVALFASVRLHKQQQVLDFQLIYANGKTKQGSISYPSLPAATYAIGRQLLHLLRPDRDLSLPSVQEDPIVARTLAEGIQSLQQAGPFKAKKYFHASLVLDDTNHWARAYLARTNIALGDWQVAEQLFAQISAISLAQDPSLDAFIQYWRFELAYRRGQEDLEQYLIPAIKKAKAVGNTTLLARSYRMQAQISWQQMDWSAHRKWLAKAEQLFTVNSLLNIEADNLFYLGNLSNGGLEKNPNNDLQLNRERLMKALNFYQQMGNQNMIAASQFAIAQNYAFTLAQREQSLKQTLTLYRQLQQPYELVQVLLYAGFYQMQLHDGVTASKYFIEAKKIAQGLGAQKLVENSRFFLGFAMLDQGLDQSALGRHGKDEKKLYQAIELLESFIATKPSQEMQSSALVFLGWANTDLGHLDLALEQLNQAKAINQKFNFQTTFGYSSYSIMRIHLARGDYKLVTDMADEPITTNLQARFLARAYYEQGELQQAINVLQDAKQQRPTLWQNDDIIRLAQYRSAQSGTKINLSAEPLAHLVYCESDWSQ